MKRMSKILSLVLLLGMLLSLLPAAALAEGETPVTAARLEALADGDTVVIYHPASKTALTATASGKKLSGAAAEAADGKLTVTDEMAQLKVALKDGVYSFSLDGKFLTSGATGNSLSFAEDGESDLAKWTVAKVEGGWTLMNVGAAYNDNHDQALEYYNGFTTYGFKADNAAYIFEFYGLGGETPEPQPAKQLEKLTEAPASGAQLVIYHPTSGMAMTGEADGDKLKGTEAALEGGKLALTEEMALLTVGLTGEVYTFALNGQVLTSGATGNSLSFAAPSDLGTWTLSRLDGFWKVLNTTAVYNNKAQALEYYRGFTTYGEKDTDAYKFDFYAERPVTPTADAESGEIDAGTVVNFSCATPGAVISYSTDGETWTEGTSFTVNEDVELKVRANLGGLLSPVLSLSFTVKSEEPAAETLDKIEELPGSGSTFVIYHPTSKMTLTDTVSGAKLAGVESTLEDGKLVKAEGMAVLTATLVDENTYTLQLGDQYLTSAETGNGLSFAADGESDLAKWVIALEDGTFTLTNVGAAYNDVHNQALEYYKGFTTYGFKADNAAYLFEFYGTAVEEPGPGPAAALTDGMTVAIYSPSHGTAISNKPNGDSSKDKDWYLKAVPATVDNGSLVNFTEDLIWTVKANEDGSYSFIAYGDETRGIAVWASGNYAELSVDIVKRADKNWTVTPAATEGCFYINSTTVSGTNGPAYIEAYLRNGTEVFSGYFVTTESDKFKESEFALQFYPVNPEDASEAGDDGEWDGVIEKGKQVLAYNATAGASMGLAAKDTMSLSAVPTAILDGKADAANGAYVFTVDTMGRYYSFEIDGKYLATNDAEELFFVEKNEEGKLPETAKWFLSAQKNDEGELLGYVIYNKEANYGGTPICIEFFSNVFSGWTFKPATADIFLFKFYEPIESAEIRKGVVQAPFVLFESAGSRYIEQDYAVEFTLEDLAEEIVDVSVSFTAGDKTGTVTELELAADKKAGSFTIPAAEIDSEAKPESFTVTIEVTNSYGIHYTGEKIVAIVDEPFFSELTPEPNAQTGEETKPVISAKIGNAGENPTVVMAVNDVIVEAAFADGVVSYTPAEALPGGRATVAIEVTRADGVKAEKTWSFTVGSAAYQLYFGQLHSHTTYSDGSGTLDSALAYVAGLPKSANVQFVAFTDHSNYFDSSTAPNPADALNDKTKMTADSLAVWEEYKAKVAAFNEAHEGELVAIAGFEMTWSGGPGHINTFMSDGLVSRNNAELNNKSGDAGMKLYYQILNKGTSLSQFNHPGSTFGTFTDFSYWDAETDAHIFLVEVGNGEGPISAVGNGYYPSYEQYIVALDKGWHLAPTNNQDNHKGKWGNANDARDVVLTNDFSEQGIYDAIRQLRVYATEDKNLHIQYSINDRPMGTIFDEDNSPEKLNVMVALYDPDAGDSISKVELVANGGVTAYTWDDAAAIATGLLTAELDPEYSYYFVRVTQGDGDLAVTAPIWVGTALKIGIESFEPETETVYKGEEATLITSFFNRENTYATVKSLVYTVNGGEVIGTDTTGYTVSAGGTLPVSFKHSFDKAKLTTVTVTAVVEFEGKEYTYTANVDLDVLDREAEGQVSTVAAVRAASDPADTGYRFTIEGVVTSNASGYDKDTAFFDCIYVQDESAGICCFPVAGEFKIGDKVRIVGHTDFYQGEPELQVQSIEKIDEGEVAPTEIKASQLNDRSAEGLLVTVKGTVESFELANGLIQTIMIKDAEGNLARVFIDGYITASKEVANCEVGAEITATGLASYDNTFNPPDGPFPRIRIRNRDDVVCSVVERPATPTVTPAPGLVDKGTELTFACETEGAEIWYSTDSGATWVKGDKFTVNENVTLQVKAVKDGVDSEIATFAYTIINEEEALYIDLDANGGKVSVTRLRLGVDGSVPALPVPQEREGYIFGGWFTAKEDGGEVKQGDILTESMTLYAHWYELRATVQENAVVPTALKTTYTSVDAMKSAMLKTVQRRLGVTTVKGNKLYEVKVEYNDGTGWKQITAAQFPTIGVKVSMTIPTGSSTNDRFVALHLFGEDCNGHKAGEGEMPAVTKNGTTISFTVHGTSPLLIVWTGTGGTTGPTTPTGDNSNIGLWIAILAASAVAIIAIVVIQKKKGKK